MGMVLGWVVKVLVACEFSGVVRDEFAKRGHEAVSCDLLPTERPGAHYVGDVRDLLEHPWDLMIAHPPCRFLAVSGARWKYEKPGWAAKQEMALEFVHELLDAPIEKIALENPVSIISTRIRKPDQWIQPWQFWHEETREKRGLWLKNLPLLVPTNVVRDRDGRLWKIGPSRTRPKDRSRTLIGIARAMAEQWG